MINIGKGHERANIHIIGVSRQEKQNNKIQKKNRTKGNFLEIKDINLRK